MGAGGWANGGGANLTITTGQAAPDGTTGAIKLASAVSQQYVYFLTTPGALATGDWVVAGYWMRYDATGVPSGTWPSDLTFLAGGAHWDDATTTAYTLFPTTGVDKEWQWVTIAKQIGTVTNAGDSLLWRLFSTLNFNNYLYSPVFYYLPAATWTNSQAGEFAMHMQSNPSYYTGAGVAGMVPGVVLGTQEARVYGLKGQYLDISQATEVVTIAAGASVDSTTNLLPANAVILGVPAYTVTTITSGGATTGYTVGDAGSGTRYSTATVGLAAGTNDPGTKAGAYYNATAAKVRLTATGGNFGNGGTVRLTSYYYTIKPPTS